MRYQFRKDLIVEAADVAPSAPRWLPRWWRERVERRRLKSYPDGRITDDDWFGGVAAAPLQWAAVDEAGNIVASGTTGANGFTPSFLATRATIDYRLDLSGWIGPESDLEPDVPTQKEHPDAD